MGGLDLNHVHEAKGDVEVVQPVSQDDFTGLSGDAIQIDPEEEKRLVWKLDLHILPFVVLLYLFSFLDRGEDPCLVFSAFLLHPLTLWAISAVNIGNSRLYGMEEDLGLVGDQYLTAVSILFVTYCVCSGCFVF